MSQYTVKLSTIESEPLSNVLKLRVKVHHQHQQPTLYLIAQDTVKLCSIESEPLSNVLGLKSEKEDKIAFHDQLPRHQNCSGWLGVIM